MLKLALTIYSQTEMQLIPSIQILDDLFTDIHVIEPCEKYRSTFDLPDKLNIPVVLASGRFFFVDIDGSNHKDGNLFDIPFEEIAKLVPHAAWFISPSGKGMKLLIEISRDYTPDEKDGIRIYLFETIAKLTGLKVDPCRTDLAFATDFPLHKSDGIFPIPDVLEKRATKRIHDPMACTVPLTTDLAHLAEILDMCEEVMTYNKWFSIIIAALKLYGENSIPLLESKWESGVPYASLLKYSDDYNFNILESIWATRTRKCGYTYSDQHKRLVVAGATGSGKSAYAIKQIKTSIVDRADVQSNYVIYVVSSVEQAIDFGKKLEQNKISFEILVSKQTYMAAKPDIKIQIATSSSHNKNVKLIQLAALKSNSHYKHVYRDTRRLRHIYIDELTLTDFVRPSIMKSNISRAFLKIYTDDDMMSYYKKQFGAKDLYHAKKLAENGDDSHFISSLLYQDADTTVLTTEELTIGCLELLRFKKIVIKKEETEAYRDSCTLHLSESTDYVLEYVQSDEFGLFTKEHKFKEVFANNCEFATGNLITIKGQHLVGKNLTVIRCLPREVVGSISDLFAGCFRSSQIDPVALYYKDSLMQAVGRSIGFRGKTEAWVMVHSRVWSMIQHLDFIYKIDGWDVEIDPELQKKLQSSRLNRKELAKTKDTDKSIFWKKEKAAKIAAHLTVTGDPKDILTPSDVKSIFGKGFTLNRVADTYNLIVKKNKRCNYIEGLKKTH